MGACGVIHSPYLTYVVRSTVLYWYNHLRTHDRDVVRCDLRIDIPDSGRPSRDPSFHWSDVEKVEVKIGQPLH